MRIFEKNQLQEFSKSFDEFVIKYKKSSDLYENINKFEEISLQDFSCAKDLEFLDQISKVLNVIISIIARPQISNKREDIIVRIEQVPHMTAESIQSVLKDTTLWKESDEGMLPEYIHYYQHIDELNIYENQFIVLLINLIKLEIVKYLDFYTEVIPSFDGSSNLNVSSESIYEVIAKLSSLRSKIKNILNTRFYKEISKKLTISKDVKPTNILVKNSLYRHCFKFYRQLMIYDDDNLFEKDLRKYHLINLLKAFSKEKFVLKKGNIRSIDKQDCEMFFENDDFSISINYYRGGLRMVVKHIETKTYAYHALFFKESLTTHDYVKLDNVELFDTQEYISLWNVYEINDVKIIKKLSNAKKESVLIQKWLESKLTTINANHALYEKICPICKSREVEVIKNKYHCDNCKSSYVLFKKKNKENIWLTKIRRV